MKCVGSGVDAMKEWGMRGRAEVYTQDCHSASSKYYNITVLYTIGPIVFRSCCSDVRWPLILYIRNVNPCGSDNVNGFKKFSKNLKYCDQSEYNRFEGVAIYTPWITGFNTH